MRNNTTPLQKEWEKLEKQETAFLQKRVEKTDSRLNQLLAKKIPANLQSSLDAAFFKAFTLIFEKGTGVIEKTYKRDDLQKTYRINEYAASVRGNQKALKVFSRRASGAGTVNLLISGASGIGLGILGIGLPDIVLFTGLMLKSVYEIALNYGFDYQEENEKRFILLLIQGALSYGMDLDRINTELNHYMKYGSYYENNTLEDCIKETAGCLSKELLYMKFLQGIPIVGAAGGAYDAIYMSQVVKYSEMKYRRRFYEGKLL